jgi:hypothetical protein
LYYTRNNLDFDQDNYPTTGDKISLRARFPEDNHITLKNCFSLEFVIEIYKIRDEVIEKNKSKCILYHMRNFRKKDNGQIRKGYKPKYYKKKSIYKYLLSSTIFHEITHMALHAIKGQNNITDLWFRASDEATVEDIMIMVFPSGTSEIAGGYNIYEYEYYDLLFDKKIKGKSDDYIIQKYYKDLNKECREFNPPMIMPRIDGNITLKYSKRNSRGIKLNYYGKKYDKLPKASDRFCNDAKNEALKRYLIPFDCDCK